MNLRIARVVALLLAAWLTASPITYAQKQDPPTPSDEANAGTPAGQPADESIGRRVTNFVLPDAAGKATALADFGDARYMVVIFMGTACPISNSYIPDLNALQQQYEDKGVQVIGINANLSDSAESIAKHVGEFQVGFPVLVDGEQVAADLFDARRTPEAFVLDQRRRIRYRGRIDDRLGYEYKRGDTKRSDLEQAVNELLADKKVSVAYTKVEGCKITRRASLRQRGEVTYAKDVASILHKRCAGCHHPGTAAPFSLLEYDGARDWSDMIREVILQRRMPPWDADARYGHFSNDLRMPKEEVDTVVAWIDDGAPLGDEKDLPTPPQFAEGWMIGEPDVVFKMPREYTVPASGTVEYQYFVTPTNFEQDMWVQASEARPGNWAVVHHIIAFIREKGSTSRRNLAGLGGFAPGEEPMVYPDGIGLRVPAGAEIVWQVHYTLTGKVEKDQSELGLIFCKEPPKRAAKGGGAFNFTFGIPPGAENHRVVSQVKFDKDIELISLMPHMHLRGKDFRYTAQYPDGGEEILLNVPNYDFNWQHRYRFAEPVAVPKGTTLKCLAHFDNSANNPANPDPTETVRWGDQTWEEMMIGWYSYVDAEAEATESTSSDSAEAKSDDASTSTKESDQRAATQTGRILKRTYDFKEAQKKIEYALYVPTKYDAEKKFPLIIALHGLYSNPRQILGYPGFVDHAEKHGYILAAPMGYNNRGWYGSRGKGGGRGNDPKNLGELSEKDVINVLEIVRKDFNIDQDRVYLYGHSMGGGGSLYLAMQHPDIWAGMALMAPATPFRLDRLEKARHIPSFVVQGDQDRLVPVAGVRRWVEEMKELDMDHRYIEVEGGGHIKVAFDYFDEIFEFFDERKRQPRTEQ